MDYETVIGLEVHAQLLTRSKMYCRCNAEYASACPNTHVCPVCLGLPGVLPVINDQAADFTIMTALALHCTISGFTKFDRKNYPYPDLMKGYQISQYDAPFGRNGWLDIEVEGQSRRLGITRVHLEEDVAKLQHCVSPLGETYSLVDVNRAGAPLMEIVGEPDLRSPEEARQYLMKLHGILRYLGVSTANMEEGSFRCDANISIRPKGSDKLQAKVEVKNMNSFRAVYRALEFEADRQSKAAARGERLAQETRGWVEEKGETVSQRSKEYAHDYRYFPEPDLPPLVISAEWVERVRAQLPELPEARRDRFMRQYGRTEHDARNLTDEKPMADLFEELVRVLREMPEMAHLSLEELAKVASNWCLGEVNRIAHADNKEVSDFRARVPPQQLGAWIASSTSGVVNTSSAKWGLEQTYKTQESAQQIILKHGLAQVSELGDIVSQVIKSNAAAVADYRAGKAQSVTFLVGQVMKATRGRANPKIARELLEKKLAELSSRAG